MFVLPGDQRLPFVPRAGRETQHAMIGLRPTCSPPRYLGQVSVRIYGFMIALSNAVPLSIILIPALKGGWCRMMRFLADMLCSPPGPHKIFQERSRKPDLKIVFKTETEFLMSLMFLHVLQHPSSFSSLNWQDYKAAVSNLSWKGCVRSSSLQRHQNTPEPLHAAVEGGRKSFFLNAHISHNLEFAHLQYFLFK